MEPVTDRTAYRLECFIIDGVAQLSFSGYFEPHASLADKDRLVDELMAVAERQRAKQIILQVQAERDANTKVLTQERERLGKVMASADAQKANGGLQDATASAMTASQQNIQRLENKDAEFSVRIDSLKQMLREQPASGS